MQRTVSVLLASLVAGLLMTGCPEKRAEKEEPAAPAAAPGPKPQAHGATDDKATEDDHGDEGAPDEHPDDANDKRAVHHRRPDKKEQAGDAKDQGGW